MWQLLVVLFKEKIRSENVAVLHMLADRRHLEPQCLWLAVHHVVLWLAVCWQWSSHWCLLPPSWPWWLWWTVLWRSWWCWRVLQWTSCCCLHPGRWTDLTSSPPPLTRAPAVAHTLLGCSENTEEQDTTRLNIKTDEEASSRRGTVCSAVPV